MKNLFTVILAIFTLASSGAYADNIHDGNVTVQITGMHCEACAKSLNKKFKKQDSVENIAVDFDTQTFTIDVKENTNLTDDTIKEIIDWGGYELIEISRP
jgi:copper chaperone CopZ